MVLFHYDNGFIITTDKGSISIPISRDESTYLVKQLLNHFNTVDFMNPPVELKILPPIDYEEVIAWFESLKYTKIYSGACVLFASNSLDGGKSCRMWLIDNTCIKYLDVYPTLNDLVELMCLYL